MQLSCYDKSVIKFRKKNEALFQVCVCERFGIELHSVKRTFNLFYLRIDVEGACRPLSVFCFVLFVCLFVVFLLYVLFFVFWFLVLFFCFLFFVFFLFFFFFGR